MPVFSVSHRISISVHMNTLISSAWVSEYCTFFFFVPNNKKVCECNSKINHWTEINLKKQPRSQTFTPGTHQHITFLLVYSPPGPSIIFFSLRQLQPIPNIAANFLYLRAAAAILPLPVGQGYCNTASSAMWDTLQHSVMEHCLCQGHTGSSQYVEGRWLRHTELKIDSGSHRGQRSPHSFILCGHVLQPGDWDTCCVPVPQYIVKVYSMYHRGACGAPQEARGQLINKHSYLSDKKIIHVAD